MCNSCQIKHFPIRLFKDIDEPAICDNKAVFIQNSNNGSKIIVYNIKTGEMKSVAMKNTFCFNAHSDNKSIAFEISGSRRSIGIINTKTLELSEINNIANGVVLGGIWDNNLILRRGQNIELYDISLGEITTIASCHHILGSPVTGYNGCAWLQIYKGRCCIAFYDIKKKSNLIIPSSGYINKMYIIENYLVYQNCSNNKCCIYMFNTLSGQLNKIFESYEWVELYKGKNGVLVWTVRKEYQRIYLFDVFIYNTNNDTMVKVLSDCKNAVIPTVSNDVILWVDANMEGDSLCLMPVEL